MLRPHVLVQHIIVKDHVSAAQLACVVHQLDDLLLRRAVRLPVLREALVVVASDVLPQAREVDWLVASPTEGLDAVGQRVAEEFFLLQLWLLDDKSLGGLARTSLAADNDLVCELLGENLAHLSCLDDAVGLA